MLSIDSAAHSKHLSESREKISENLLKQFDSITYGTAGSVRFGNTAHSRERERATRGGAARIHYV